MISIVFCTLLISRKTKGFEENFSLEFAAPMNGDNDESLFLLLIQLSFYDVIVFIKIAETEAGEFGGVYIKQRVSV